MFLNDYWYAGALSAEIGQEPLARTICGRALVLFRSESGRLVVLEDRCAHRHAPLSLGKVEGESIRCAYHGLRYAADGRCIEVPGQAAIPPKARVRAYPAQDRHGWIWVWIGSEERADPALIPDYPWFADPGWSGFQLYFHVNGAAQLFVDNLLDLSHVAFTHGRSIGAASAGGTVAHLDVAVEDDLVRGCRALRDVEPGPFIARWGGFTGRINRTSSFTWRAPSNVAIEAVFDEADRRITIMVINPITPETAVTSHFWIGWARDFALGDPALTERAKAENTQVIMEDVRVIEAQQRVLSAHAHVEPVPINADRALVAVHQVLKRLGARP